MSNDSETQFYSIALIQNVHSTMPLLGMRAVCFCLFYKRSK